MALRLFSSLVLLSHAATADIVSLELVDSSTGQGLGAMYDQMVIDISQLGVTDLTIRADTDGSDDCIEFDLDGGLVTRTEYSEPYYLAGDAGNEVYSAKSLNNVGEHTLIVRPCGTSGKVIRNARGHGQPPKLDEMVKPLKKPKDFVKEKKPKKVKVGKPEKAVNAKLDKPDNNGKPDKPDNNGKPDKPDSKVKPNKPEKTKMSAFVDRPGDRRELLKVDGGIAITFTVTDDSFSNDTGAKPTSDIPAYDSDIFGALTGELKKWHKVTLGFVGPLASEFGMTVPGKYRAPSTFADYRLGVLFTHEESGKQYFVPGYFAGNGDAANGSYVGQVWLCHFRPDETGIWTWVAEFHEGTNVAQNSGGSAAGHFNGVNGSFTVEDTDKAGPDLRGKGRLNYVGETHLQFAETGEYFIKVGPDSPSNLLAYEDFDGTPNGGGNLKSYANHADDYFSGQPTWSNGKGQNLIGAINYLASKGVNMISVTTLSDDNNVFPFLDDKQYDTLKYDISKLGQWEVVFDWAEENGIALNIKLEETISGDIFGDDALSEERKLYYREMIARFGHHLGLTFTLGKDELNTDAIIARSEYFKSIDPYQSPLIVHAAHEDHAPIFGALIGVPTIDGVAIQTTPSEAFADTLAWIKMSQSSGRPWVVSVDQQDDEDTGVTPDGDNNNHDIIREQVLWGNIMVGGSGVQYFFGYSLDESDYTLEDFRSRDEIFTQSKYAIDFFDDNNIPFETMSPMPDCSSDYGITCLADGMTVVVHKNSGTSETAMVTIPGSSATQYSVEWFNPKTGGPLITGDVSTVTGGQATTLGSLPGLPQQDLVALLRCQSCAD